MTQMYFLQDTAFCFFKNAPYTLNNHSVYFLKTKTQDAQFCHGSQYRTSKWGSRLLQISPSSDSFFPVHTPNVLILCSWVTRSIVGFFPGFLFLLKFHLRQRKRPFDRCYELRAADCRGQSDRSMGATSGWMGHAVALLHQWHYSRP